MFFPSLSASLSFRSSSSVRADMHFCGEKTRYSFPCNPWFVPGKPPQILEPSFRCRLLKPFLIWNQEEDSQRVFKWHLWQGTMCYRPSYWLRVEIVGPRMTIYFAAWIQYADCCTNKIAMVGKKVKIRVDPEVEIRLQWKASHVVLSLSSPREPVSAPPWTRKNLQTCQISIVPTSLSSCTVMAAWSATHSTPPSFSPSIGTCTVSTSSSIS